MRNISVDFSLRVRCVPSWSPFFPSFPFYRNEERKKRVSCCIREFVDKEMVVLSVAGPTVGNWDAPRCLWHAQRSRTQASGFIGQPRWRRYAAEATRRDEPEMASSQGEEHGYKVRKKWTFCQNWYLHQILFIFWVCLIFKDGEKCDLDFWRR